MKPHQHYLIYAALAVVISLGIGASFALTPPATGIAWQRVLPKPPVSGSEIDRADATQVRDLQRLINTPRWTQAKSDVSYDMFTVFGPIVGLDFTAVQQPQIAALLTYASRYTNRASNEAKAVYARARPHAAMSDVKTCQAPAPINSSFPSGHAAWGVVAANIVARLYPASSPAILARGLDYGQSRVVCGVHYPSDIVAGRIMAVAILARLDHDPEFLRLMAAAK